MTPIPGSLRALLSGLIDYAGLYPPACLPIAIVCERYQGFLNSPENWILNRLVLPASALSQVTLEEDWRISLLVEGEPGELPPQVETLEARSSQRLSLPTYCEVPIAEIQDGYAKIRTGGLSPEKIPTAETVADFLVDAAARKLPFKATAGLHHPIHSMQALTYDRDSARAVVHGFLNVFLAAVFARQGVERPVLVEILEETDPAAFRFDNGGVRWHGLSLETARIRSARRDFAHSFGSCSFEEPISDLNEIGLLP